MLCPSCNVWSPPEEWERASRDWRLTAKTCPRCGAEGNSREIDYRVYTAEVDESERSDTE
jgi:hypothetical protein